MKSFLTFVLISLCSTLAFAEDCTVKVSSKTQMKLFGSIFSGGEKLPESVAILQMSLKVKKKVKSVKVKVTLIDGMVSEEDMPEFLLDCRKAKKKLHERAQNKKCDEQTLEEIAGIECSPFAYN